MGRQGSLASILEGRHGLPALTGSLPEPMMVYSWGLFLPECSLPIAPPPNSDPPSLEVSWAHPPAPTPESNLSLDHISKALT